jgi:hypothetical protein
MIKKLLVAIVGFVIGFCVVTIMQGCGRFKGEPGPQGPIGDTGAVGATGPTGQGGSSCTVTNSSGGAVIACTDGSEVTVLNGTDGSIIQLIQFCPGVPSYPNNFLEVGVCIDQKLYAVYSHGNNTFLTLVPPGRYVTTDQTRCNFTVRANCEVENE